VVVARAPATPPEADGAVTRTPGLPLVVLTADCAPVALADDVALAVAHAGHDGLRAGVLEATVAALRSTGSGPVRAFLGPCVRPRVYEFGAADLGPFVDRFGAEVATTTATGRPALDLPLAVRRALGAVGVDDLVDDGGCTVEDPDLYSYRRDGTTGRQALVAVLDR